MKGLVKDDGNMQNNNSNNKNRNRFKCLLTTISNSYSKTGNLFIYAMTSYQKKAIDYKIRNKTISSLVTRVVLFIYK